MMVLICVMQHPSNEAQFMRELSNTEAGLRKSIVYRKKGVVLMYIVATLLKILFTKTQPEPIQDISVHWEGYSK